MSDEDAAENQWIAEHDARTRAIDGLTAFLDWWDANPNDQDWWKQANPALWARFMALPLLEHTAVGTDGMSDQVKLQLRAIADKIQRCVGGDYTDHVYLCLDALFRLDTLIGNAPPRGQLVDFP